MTLVPHWVLVLLYMLEAHLGQLVNAKLLVFKQDLVVELACNNDSMWMRDGQVANNHDTRTTHHGPKTRASVQPPIESR